MRIDINGGNVNYDWLLAIYLFVDSFKQVEATGEFLSLPVQLIVWKDLSPEYHVMC